MNPLMVLEQMRNARQDAKPKRQVSVDELRATADLMRNGMPMGIAKQATAQDFAPPADLLDYSAGVPLVGDVTGPMADARMFARDPEMMTPGNVGLAVSGLLPFMPSLAGIMAGSRALTADKGLLRVAEDAEKSGLPAKKVYDATGWFRGADGEWRSEIDDSAFKIENPDVLRAMDSMRGHVNLTHPYHLGPNYNLDDAYPQITMRKGAPRVAYNFNTSGGAYSPGLNVISLGGESEPVIRSTALHELQHAVQGAEGFASGGSAERGWTREQQFELARKAYEDDAEMPTDYLLAALLDQELPKKTKMAAWDALPDREKIKWLERGRQRGYQRLAGEVEARNVQTRMNMTPDERRMRPPWTTEDVPRDQQIIRR